MNYPNGIIKPSIFKNITYKNRGISLENDLNITNNYYSDNKIAYIYKKPTPIKVVKVVFDKNNKHTIKEAYFNEPSTTDYNGIYNGYYIDFEAKETKNKKGFPINNIHPHQIQHLRNILSQNGICFLIIRFTSYNKTYLLTANDFLVYLDSNKKSYVEIEYIEKKGYLIKEKLGKRIDYLELIKKIWRI